MFVCVNCIIIYPLKVSDCYLYDPDVLSPSLPKYGFEKFFYVTDGLFFFIILIFFKMSV